MKLETGDKPTVPGHYALYFLLSKMPETVRYWNGKDWEPNLVENTLTRANFIGGFVGPLPLRTIGAAPMEFDL